MNLLKSKGLITEVIELAEVDSTNQYALNAGRPGLLVRSRVQTAGRGRRGRTWYSSIGENVYMTVTLTPPEERYPIITGIAVRAAIESLLPTQPVAIKWPNDIIISGKKVCGILCEARGAITAIGIGVNVNQQAWPVELEHRAISLKQVSQRNFSIDEVTEVIAENLYRWIEVFRSRGFGPIRDEFLCHGMLKGYDVYNDKGHRCTIIDITIDGHLVIDVDGKRNILVHEPVSLGWDKDV